MRAFSLLIHGLSGVGKSRLAMTVPGPRLLLDAEGGAAEWAVRGHAYWDPSSPLPQAEDLTPFDRAGGPITTDTTVIIIVRSWETVEKAYRVLLSGQHYFNAAIWDSITEIQDQCKRAIGVTRIQDWGDLLDRMSVAVKEWRDLRLPPSPKPISTIFTAISVQRKDGRWKADMQGKAADKLPGWVDTVGYMTASLGGTDQKLHRYLNIQPVGDFDAKDRLDLWTQEFGYTIDNPDLGVMAQALERTEPSE